MSFQCDVMGGTQKEENAIRDGLAGLMPLTDTRTANATPRRNDNGDLERRYSQAAQGHQRPKIVIKNSDDAIRHTRSLDKEHRSALALSRLIEQNLQNAGLTKKENSESMQKITEIVKIISRDNARTGFESSLAFGLIAASNDQLSGQVMGWLDNNYLGTGIYGRFSGTQPFLSTEKPSFFKRTDEVYSRNGSVGYCFYDTNHIIISPTIMHEADRLTVIAHEQLHYASWLGGGHDIRWRNERGEPIIAAKASWIHEGMTELHAQLLVRDHGHEPSDVAYPYETTTACYLQRLVVLGIGDETRGKELFRNAYLSGDFTQIRSIVDRSLGSGTFDTIMGLRDLPVEMRAKFGHSRVLNGIEALYFLTARLDSSSIKYLDWNENAIVSKAGVTFSGKRLGSL